MDARNPQIAAENYFQIVETQGDWKSRAGNAARQRCAQNLSLIMWPSICWIATMAVLEVAYARAVGRGKDAEADAAWGRVIASAGLDKSNHVVNESG